jgi:hypothetical protein
MESFWLIVAIFFIEIVNSFCSDTRNVKVTHSKEWEADLYDLIASTATWVEGFLVYVSYRDFGLSVPSIIASVIGTHLAARRIQFSFTWPFIRFKKRKISSGRRKASQFTNA